MDIGWISLDDVAPSCGEHLANRSLRGGFEPDDGAAHEPPATRLRREYLGRSCQYGLLLIPGEPEAKMRAERTRNGVPLPDDTWAAIVNTAREVGVGEVSIQRATA